MIYRTVALFLILLLSTESGADVVKLKNGRRLEGAIIKQTKDAIVMDIGVGEASVNRGDIASIELAKEDDAAIYYIRAMKAATYIEPGEMKKKVEKMERDKWQADGKEIEEVLGQNKKCLEELTKGLSIEKCDFGFEQKYRYDQDRGHAIEHEEVRALGLLPILKGRDCEKRQNYGEAVDWYLNALKFASQISGSDDPDLKYEALTIEKEVYPLIKGYLNSVNVAKNDCRKILDFLDGHEKSRFSRIGYITEEKESFLNLFRKREHGVILWSRENSKIDIKTRKKAVRFMAELVKQAAELADRYYDKFLTAAKTGAEIDWMAAQTEFDKLIRENKVQPLTDEIDRSKFRRDSFGDMTDVDKKDSRNIAMTYFIYYISSMKSGLDNYKAVVSAVSELQALAKLKSVTTYK